MSETPSSSEEGSVRDISPRFLNYESTSHKARFWKHICPSPRVWALLAVVVAILGGWRGWQWRLTTDAAEFIQQADIDTRMNFVSFHQTPTRAGLRHLARLPGEWSVRFRMSGKPDLSTPKLFAGRTIDNVISVHFVEESNLTAWLRELSSSDSNLRSVTHLSLWGNSVSDKDLAELGNPDSGMKALTKVSLYGTKVTDKGANSLQKVRPEVTVSR